MLAFVLINEDKLRPREMKLFYRIIGRKKWIQNRVCLQTYGFSTTCFLFLMESERRGKRYREKRVWKLIFAMYYTVGIKGENQKVWIWVIGKRVVLWKEREIMNWVFDKMNLKVLKIDVRFPNVIWKSYFRYKS